VILQLHQKVFIIMGDSVMADGSEMLASGDNVHSAYVLSLDVGTTTIRAHVYDRATTIRGTGVRKVGIVQTQFFQAE
jgi:hypothetical protein